MDIVNIVNKQRSYFFTNETKSLKFRLNALKKLQKAIDDNEKEIIKALNDDLNKSETEGYMTEISMVKSEIKYMIKKLPRFIKQKKVRTSLQQIPGKCFEVNDPYGVVLIMSPWNYPFLLTIDPLIGAIAAGNCVVLKPSIYSKNTSAIISKIIKDCFINEYCCVVEGGREENQELLKQKFDYIFFTGSIEVGKLVMEMASKNLTPVSLELGGKSPVIIDETANIDLASKRIVFGKFINAGQTCVAPDYILVCETKKEELLESLKKWVEEFYPFTSDNKILDYPRIINQKHFTRLVNLIDETKLYYGGEFEENNLTIYPTILKDVTFLDKVMQEEIFGPILPVITYQNLDEVIDRLHSSPKPLALYLFTTDKKVKKKVLEEVSFGGGCINDTIMHLASPFLGFGGVGSSGMGSYHGKKSFDTFTHKKSIVDKGAFDLPVRFRPYTKLKRKILRKI